MAGIKSEYQRNENNNSNGTSPKIRAIPLILDSDNPLRVHFVAQTVSLCRSTPSGSIPFGILHEVYTCIRVYLHTRIHHQNPLFSVFSVLSAFSDSDNSLIL